MALSAGTIGLFVAAFLASAVEFVEAFTIVLAMGITRSWRATLIGSAVAVLALAAITAVAGVALVNWISTTFLQLLIGTLLLIFGLQWLRKAILRAAGRKARHDEELIFQREVAQLHGELARGEALDWTGFVVSFKGVFLEGLEVAFIVLTFGTNEGRFDLSIAGAVAAFLLVAAVGAAVHQPLSHVPENTIKFAVGLMLTAFGTFWGGEGVGIEWALGDLMLPLLVVLYGVAATVLVWLLKPRPAPLATPGHGRSIP